MKLIAIHTCTRIEKIGLDLPPVLENVEIFERLQRFQAKRAKF